MLRRLAAPAALLTLAQFLVATPASAEVPAAQPKKPVVAPPGPGPVDRALPSSSASGHGLAKGERPPVVPPGIKASGKPARVKSTRLAKPQVRALDAPTTPGPGARDVLLRSGFEIADTSLVLYFDSDDTADWQTWKATVFDPATGTAQESASLAASDLAKCTTPRDFCRTFGAKDGWVLEDGHDYFATVTVTKKDATEVVSEPSANAKARATIEPPAIPADQAAGCACGNVLHPTAVGQAVRGGGVNTGTGSFTFSSNDLRMAGFGVTFDAVRRYSSTNTGAGSMGLGWAWSYDVRVIPPAGDATAVTVRADDGAQVTYGRNEDGSFKRPAGVRSNLSATGTGWKLVTPAQITYAFDGTGRLTSVKNSRGLGLTLAYTATQQKITDAAGRVVTVDLGSDGLIRKMSLPDGRNVRYGYTNGQMTAATDADGNTWKYQYVGTLLSKVIDPEQRTQVSTTYQNNRVASQTDALGKITTFAWDAGKQEATTTDPDGVVYFDGYRGNVLVYSQNGNGDTTNQRYDQQIDPTLLVDAKGNQTVSAYDGASNMVSQSAPEPFNYTVSNTFDPHNNLTSHTDGLGKTSTYGYNAFDEIQRITDFGDNTTILTVDDRGLVTAITDPRNKKTTFAYDAAGNLIERATPLGEKTGFGYDQVGRPVSETDPRGTVAGADRDDFTTRYVYDNLDRLRKTYDPGKREPWITEYDELGQVVRAVDPLDNATTYSYTKVIGRTASVTDPTGSKTEYTYTAAGRRSSVTDALGGRTTLAYDNRGNLSTVVSPRGNVKGANPAQFTTTYTYDFNNNLVRARRPYPGGGFVTVDAGFDEMNRGVTSTNAFGKVTTTKYDNNHQVTSTVDPLGQETSFSYDENGRPTAVTTPGGSTLKSEYDAAGNPIARTTGTGGKTTWAYDDDGRVLTAVEARGNAEGANAADFTTSYAYDRASNLTSVTDALGATTRFGYSAVNKVVSNTDRDGNTTTLSYDDANRLTRVVAPTKATTKYEYDRVGHVVKRVDPNGHLGKYGYDALGRIATVTDAIDRTSSYAYDAEGNMIRYTAPGYGSSDAAQRSIVNTFDLLGRQVGQDQGAGDLIYAYGYDADNRMTSMADANGLRTMSYDADDQLTRVSRDGQDFSYGYDADGNVTSRTWPDGTKIAASFNDANQMTSLSASDGVAGSAGVSWSFGYDVAGRLTKTTLPGAVTDRSYDRAGRLDDLNTTQGGNVLARYQITRDPVGNPTAITTTRGTATQDVRYSYDAANRITSACYNASGCADSVSYSYDGVGNRLTQKLSGTAGSGTTKYSYDDADQLVEAYSPERTGGNTIKFQYDSQGNMIKAGSDSFAYNLDKTMASATVGGKQVSFSYDGQGLQIGAISGSGADVATRTWKQDINGTIPSLALETVSKGDSSTTRGFLTDAGTSPLAMLTSDGAATYVPDWLNGVADVLDDSGAVLAAYDYDPYGNARTNGTAASVAGAGTDNPVKFAGGYQDGQLGSQYSFPARTYDPSTGRFGGTDPVARPLRAGAVSTYGYVEGRPTVLRDPSGASSDPDHDAAEELALEQLDPKYGPWNVYAADVPGRRQLRGVSTEICIPTFDPQPGEPASSCPDIIARFGAQTLLWEVKHGTDQLSAGHRSQPIREYFNANQVNRYLRSLTAAGWPNPRPGPDIVPASRVDSRGTLTIFSRVDWAAWARPGARPATDPANASGIIYYFRVPPPPVPTGKPTGRPTPGATEEPTEEPTSRPVDKPVQSPVDEPVVAGSFLEDALLIVAAVAVVALVIVLLPEEILVGAAVALFGWAMSW
ncbi:RHS repeat-associated core domain-containing protein [Actinoplanes sp. CA-142083]|uniref:RHS repeat-associated core domain-containing protein n=1 Tax=Actinoplanes sp. CA-142083 TaxID=3239903 RepID=UPI003D8E8B87